MALTFAYHRLIVIPSRRLCISSSFAYHFHFLPPSCCSRYPRLLLNFLFFPDIRYPVDSSSFLALSFDLLALPPIPPISSAVPFGTTCVLLFPFYLLSAYFSKLPGLFLCSIPGDPFFSPDSTILALWRLFLIAPSFLGDPFGATCIPVCCPASCLRVSFPPSRFNTFVLPSGLAFFRFAASPRVVLFLLPWFFRPSRHLRCISRILRGLPFFLDVFPWLINLGPSLFLLHFLHVPCQIHTVFACFANTPRRLLP